MLVGGRRDGRDLGDDPMGEDLAVARVMDVHRVVIERRHRGDDRRHHRHRMRVVVEAIKEAQQRLVDHRVMTDVGVELLQLGLGGQLAAQQQVAHLHESALLGELFDRIAPVQQHAGVAVDIGDPAFAGRGHAEARVVGENPVVLGDVGDVEYGRPDGAGLDGEQALLARGKISEFEVLVGHGVQFPQGV